MASYIGRRKFLATLGGAAVAWPLAARAQSQLKMLRVGFVGIQPRESWLYATFLERMTELGYQEGRNFTFEYIQTPNIEGYEKGYRELAARKVDVFLAVGNERALRAALSAAEGRPSPRNASRSLARRSRARKLSGLHSIPSRVNNAMRQPKRPASWAWSRA
jgi:hypothetical protein